MDLKAVLSCRIGLRDIRAVCAASGADSVKTELLSLAFDSDDRTAYNALWALTHFPGKGRDLLLPYRDRLIDCLLATAHVGRRRLMLSLLDALPCEAADIRTDYLDFCLDRINSTEPYGVRALCLRQAYAQCRHYPELIHELRQQMQIMALAPLSPGLRSVLRHISRLLPPASPSL